MYFLSDSLRSCAAIANGTLFNGDHQDFVDMLQLYINHELDSVIITDRNNMNGG